MRSLDNVPVPMTDLDRLLIEFKFRRILQYLDGKILDVGCGVGFMTNLIRQRGFDVEGLDGSKKRVKQARQDIPKVKFHCKKFGDFKPKTLYDVVLVSSVLEHLPDPELSLKWFGTWLRPGGSIIVLVPNCRALHKRVGYHLGYREKFTEADKEVGHIQLYTLNKLFDQLIRTGFKVRSHGGVLMKPKHNRSLQYWSKELLEAYFEVSKDPFLATLCSVVYAIGEKQ